MGRLKRKKVSKCFAKFSSPVFSTALSSGFFLRRLQHWPLPLRRPDSEDLPIFVRASCPPKFRLALPILAIGLVDSPASQT
jgi:hypothetical protein